MIIAVWDFLFTRRRWEIIHEHLIRESPNAMPHGTLYVLRDQFGNIKKKTVRP